MIIIIINGIYRAQVPQMRYYTLLRHKAAINNKKHTDIYNAT